MSFKNPCTAQTFLPERLSNHCQGLHSRFSEICKKFDAIPLSVHQEVGSRHQLKGSKYQHIHLAAWNFVHWLQRGASTIIHCCLALLQLRDRWQHQPRKLWIPSRIHSWLNKLGLQVHSLDTSNLDVHINNVDVYIFISFYFEMFSNVTANTVLARLRKKHSHRPDSGYKVFRATVQQCHSPVCSDTQRNGRSMSSAPVFSASKEAGPN
jgi:hypothetical protein